MLTEQLNQGLGLLHDRLVAVENKHGNTAQHVTQLKARVATLEMNLCNLTAAHKQDLLTHKNLVREQTSMSKRFDSCKNKIHSDSSTTKV